MVAVTHLTFTTAVPRFSYSTESSADAFGAHWTDTTGLYGANIELKLFVPSNSQDLTQGFFASSWLPFVEQSTISGGSVDNPHPVASWEKSDTNIVTMVWDCSFTFTESTVAAVFYFRTPFQFPYSFTVVEIQSSPPPTLPNPTIWYGMTRTGSSPFTNPPIPFYPIQRTGPNDGYIIYIDELFQYSGPAGEALSEQLSFSLYDPRSKIYFDSATATFAYITDDNSAGIPFIPTSHPNSRWGFPDQLPPNTRRIKIQLPSPTFAPVGGALVLDVHFQSFSRPVSSSQVTLNKEKITASVTTVGAEYTFGDQMFHGMSEMKFSIQLQPSVTTAQFIALLPPPVYQRDMFFTRCTSLTPGAVVSLNSNSISVPDFMFHPPSTLPPITIECFAVFSPFASRISSTPNSQSQDEWSRTRIQYFFNSSWFGWSDFLAPSTLSSENLSTVTHSITPINVAIKSDAQPEWTLSLKFNGAIFPEMYDIKFDNFDSDNGIYFEITPISSAATTYKMAVSEIPPLSRLDYPLESLGDNTFRITAPANKVYLATELAFKIKCAYYTYPTALGDDFRWASSLNPLEPVSETVSPPSSLRVTWSRSAGPSPSIPESYSDSITFKLPHMHQPALTITSPIAQKWDMPTTTAEESSQTVVMTQITLNQHGLFYPSTSELLDSMVDNSIWYENNGALQLWPKMQIRIEIDSLNPSTHSFNLATPLPPDFVIIDDSSDDFVIFQYTGSETKTLTEGIVFDVESLFPSDSVYELIGNVSFSLSIKLDGESTFTQFATPTQPIYFGRAVINDDYTNTVLSLQSTSKLSPQTKIDIDITLKPLVPTTTTTTQSTLPVVSNDAFFTLSFIPHSGDSGFKTVSAALWEYIGQADGTVSSEATLVTDNIISITDLEADEKIIRLPSLSHHQNAFLRFTYTFIEESGRPNHVVDTTSFTIVPNCFDLKPDETESVWDSFTTLCIDPHSFCSYSTGECFSLLPATISAQSPSPNDDHVSTLSLIPAETDSKYVSHGSIISLNIPSTSSPALSSASISLSLWQFPESTPGSFDPTPVVIISELSVDSPTALSDITRGYSRAFFQVKVTWNESTEATPDIIFETSYFQLLAQCQTPQFGSSDGMDSPPSSFTTSCSSPLICEPATGQCVDHTGSISMTIHSAVTDSTITPVSIPRKIDNGNVELPIIPVVSCRDSIQVTFTPEEPLGYDSIEIQLWYVPVVGEVEQSPVKISTVADKVLGDGDPYSFPLNLKVQYTRVFFRYIYSSTDSDLETVSTDTVQFVILAECMAVKGAAVEMVFESYEPTCLDPLEDCDPETGTCQKAAPLAATQSFSFMLGVCVMGMIVMALV